MGTQKREKSKRNKNEGDLDDRFAAASSRPQFRKQKEEKSKVVLDERFSSVLTDSRFRVDAKDKYGRRKKKNRDAKDELENFYTVQKEEEEEKEDEAEKSRSSDEESSTDDASDDESDNKDEVPEDPASRIAYLTALSRGELSVSSSSDEDDSSVSSAEEAESDDDDDGSNAPGILDSSAKEEVPITEVPSPFMAVMNMDWKNVRAVDLFAILASFTPSGSVRCVQIYPSDFGMERMAKEERQGPVDIWKNEAVSNEEDLNANSDEEVSQHDTDDNESLGHLKEDVNPNAIDSAFDPEKLRAYEASKLKYYFAVVEFASPEHADIAYREVDGLELEHSSAAIDLRSIAPEELDGVKDGRKMRDEARAVPSNYEPPDFVLNALQQSNVQCTWDEGDKERELKLTGYGGGQRDAWNAMAEGDDLKAYLASDVSSDEEEDSDEGSNSGGKGSQMRQMLGLDSDSDDGDASKSQTSVDSSSESEVERDEDFNKEATFVPGKRSLEQKIRLKLQQGAEEEKELTPWEKYQQKRKEKRRERRQAARKKKDGDVHTEDNDMYGADPEFGVPDSDSEGGLDKEAEDGFFLEDKLNSGKSERDREKGQRGQNRKKGKANADTSQRSRSSKAELELLLAGDKEEEDAKDYDMRGIQRLHKNKDKKLRGARKRKEEKLAASTSGTDFKVDTADSRFAAVLDGTDDRFGIDRTDPSFKETPAMREIMSQQTKRRKAKKRARVAESVPDVTAENAGVGGGALALSSLVKNLKAKVAKSGQ